MCFSKLSKSICLISQNLEKGSGGSDKIERNAETGQKTYWGDLVGQDGIQSPPKFAFISNPEEVEEGEEVVGGILCQGATIQKV